jgi:DNA-binding transcriptional LysR family regulator
MIAPTQYHLGPADLQLTLALSRGRTLAGAADLLAQDPSTVFRALQRLERGLGRTLFERSRDGYLPNDLARELAEHAERLEAALEGARSAAATSSGLVSGCVRLTTTDTILHGLIAPALRELARRHPLLHYELQTGNELASLTRRDADIAVRATRRPSAHLVGKRVGVIRVGVYSARSRGAPTLDDAMAGRVDWVAPDDALPEHPSVVWRKRHLPKVQPRFRVNSILSVLELVALGLAVGIVPLFLAEGRKDVVRLSEPLDEGETELWLLTHPESRHLRRVSEVYSHLAQTLALP